MIKFTCRVVIHKPAAAHLMTDHRSLVVSEHSAAYITPATVNVDLNYACIGTVQPVLQQANSTCSRLTITHCTWKIEEIYRNTNSLDKPNFRISWTNLELGKRCRLKSIRMLTASSS